MVYPSPRLRKLLGAIVYQAMCDGMSAVSLGIDCETGDSTMRYFGPIDYPEEKRIWWEMVAPPPACYPQLFQIALTSARVRAEFPIQGVIPAMVERQRVELHLTVPNLASFELSWDQSRISLSRMA